jgi:MATE family multidrug resistance protein
MSVIAAVVFVFCGRWVSSFFIADPAVIAVSIRLLMVGAAFQLFDGNQVINSSALRGMTDVRIPAALTFVAYWVIAVPLAYLLGIRWAFGPVGIWIGLAFGLGVASVLLAIRFLRLTRPAA